MKLKLATLLFAALAYGPAPAAAQVVGAAQTFAVFGNTTVTNTGATMISGNLGVSPGTSITGFPPGILASGAIYTGANAVVVQAQADAQALYSALVAKPCTTNLSGTDLGGLTLTPGVYCFNGAATLTAGNATLTLDAQNSSGVFVFQIATTLTTGTNSAVNVINGNAATGVFWQLGTSATLGTGTQFAGNILANTSITVVSTARILCGRAVALNGAVTMDTNTISDNCTANNFDTGRTDFGSLGFAGAHASHDFNGDGHSDIFWRDTGGDLAVWLMNGATISQAAGLGTVPGSLAVIGQNDFNGDQRADILWRDTSGNVSMWFMNGVAVASASAVGSLTSNWALYGTGDLNGDGKGDLLWRDGNTGTVAAWFMNGATVASTTSFGAAASNWTILGDANGDILWRDTAGDIALWAVPAGTITSSTGLGMVSSNFVVQGVGDFNGDGNIDILWRDTNNGTLSIWFTNGTQVTSAANVGALAATWSVAQIGDYNADGKSDILLLDTAGDVAVWLMNGSTVTSSLPIGNVGTTWTVQNLNDN